MPDEVWCIISKKLKFADLFNSSIVSKRFYSVSSCNKKFVTTLTLSKRIIDFDPWYSEFLQDQLKWLGKEIHKKFQEKIVKNTFVFGLIDVQLEKMVYRMVPY